MNFTKTLTIIYILFTSACDFDLPLSTGAFSHAYWN